MTPDRHFPFGLALVVIVLARPAIYAAECAWQPFTSRFGRRRLAMWARSWWRGEQAQNRNAERSWGRELGKNESSLVVAGRIQVAYASSCSLHSATTAHLTCINALRVRSTYLGVASGGGRPRGPRVPA